MPSDRQAVVEDGRREQAQEAPHRGGVEEPATPVPGRHAAVACRNPPGSDAGRGTRPRSAVHRARPERRSAARPPTTVRQRDAFARPTARAIVPMPTRPATKTRIITTMPRLWMRASGMNPKMSSEPVLWGPWPAYMKRAKKAARATAMTGAHDRSGVHRPGQTGLVVARDRVAARRGHELARLGLARACLGALAAGVAGPQLLAGEQLVAHPHLGVADHAAAGRSSRPSTAGRSAVQLPQLKQALMSNAPNRLQCREQRVIDLDVLIAVPLASSARSGRTSRPRSPRPPCRTCASRSGSTAPRARIESAAAARLRARCSGPVGQRPLDRRLGGVRLAHGVQQRLGRPPRRSLSGASSEGLRRRGHRLQRSNRDAARPRSRRPWPGTARSPSP